MRSTNFDRVIRRMHSRKPYFEQRPEIPTHSETVYPIVDLARWKCGCARARFRNATFWHECPAHSRRTEE
jgi:hypothetical protein